MLTVFEPAMARPGLARRTACTTVQMEEFLAPSSTGKVLLAGGNRWAMPNV
ncbi:MAG TPA: hypothetical protein VFX62_03785 [Erythrobacter sp.]|nr:hypothetical protein [Erythrobacter sp.]